MPKKDNIENLLHDLKNPLRGMLDALVHVEDMYRDGEDLSKIRVILDSTCKTIPERWEQLNIFLEDKGN